MPPLIVAGLIGAGLYVGLRVASGLLGELANRTASMSEPQSAAAATGHLAVKDLGTLEQDPETGVYRPVPRG